MSILTRSEIRVALRKTALTDAEQELIRLVQPLAEGALKTWIQHKLEYAQYTELLPAGTRLEPRDDLLRPITVSGSRAIVDVPSGENEIQLTHTPAWNTGLVVYMDSAAKGGQASGAFGDSTLLTKGTDYWLDIDDQTNGISQSGILYHSSAWPSLPRTVKVTYYGGQNMTTLMTHGYAIKAAALQTFLNLYHRLVNASKGGMKGSEAIGKYSVTYVNQLMAQIGGDGEIVPAAVQRDLWPLRNYSYL